MTGKAALEAEEFSYYENPASDLDVEEDDTKKNKKEKHYTVNEIKVINIHLASASDEKQYKKNIETLVGLCKANENAIIGGDANIAYGSEIIQHGKVIKKTRRPNEIYFGISKRNKRRR